MSVLVFGVSMLLAQGQSIATLNHDGEVQVFYGTSALYLAHSAATHGDVITLSSGTFSASTITKELTIRGAGMQADSLTNALPTYIIGDLYLNIDTNTVYDLILEGLNIDDMQLYNDGKSMVIRNSKFIKCKIGNILNYMYRDCYNCSKIYKNSTELKIFAEQASYNLQREYEKLIQFCVEAERTNILTYERSVRLLFDAFLIAFSISILTLLSNIHGFKSLM